MYLCLPRRVREGRGVEGKRRRRKEGMKIS
jgi:hypothetical protein